MKVVAVCFLSIFFLPSSGYSTDAYGLAGVWYSKKSLGDDVQEIVEKHLYKRKRGYAGPKDSRPKSRDRTYGEISQTHYWETLNEGNLRKEARNLKRLGTAYPLLTANKLAIDLSEQELVGITYDGLLQREIQPNPRGRIFSASGDELTNDTIGHTLAYWEEETLVLETDPPHSGKFIERLKIINNGNRLEYAIFVKSMELKESINVVRVFERKK